MASRSRIRRWAPVVAWAACIFVASTTWFSGEKTGAIIVPLLGWIFPHASLPTLELVHAALRKIAHFTEYLVLALLVARALAEDGVWRPRHAVLATLCAIGYALTDELHQLLVHGRTAALRDVAIDAGGAIAGQAAIAIRRILA